MIINQGSQSRTVKLLTSKKNVRLHDIPLPPGGDHSPIWDIYIYVQPQRVWFFSAVLVINRVSILADFGHLGHKMGMVLH